MTTVNTSGYLADDADMPDGMTTGDLPTDRLVRAFVVDDLRRWAAEPARRCKPSVAHIAECPDVVADLVHLLPERSCGEGTCDFPPEVAARLSCPHRRMVTWTARRGNLAQLIEAIAEFATRRDTPT